MSARTTAVLPGLAMTSLPAIAQARQPGCDDAGRTEPDRREPRVRTAIREGTKRA